MSRRDKFSLPKGFKSYAIILANPGDGRNAGAWFPPFMEACRGFGARNWVKVARFRDADPSFSQECHSGSLPTIATPRSTCRNGFHPSSTVKLPLTKPSNGRTKSLAPLRKSSFASSRCQTTLATTSSSRWVHPRRHSRPRARPLTAVSQVFVAGLLPKRCSRSF